MLQGIHPYFNVVIPAPDRGARGARAPPEFGVLFRKAERNRQFYSTGTPGFENVLAFIGL